MASTRRDASTRAVSRRLLPLHVAVTLQGTLLWLPVEKLFMTDIGFTAASVGVMAAAYAAVTPILEVPSGILADRWSRRGVLVLSAVALSTCTVLGGLSTSVPMYVLSAMVLGVYFAMYSGTVESVVYDVVLEETGTGESYARQVGKVRLLESAALVTSSLAGGWLAGLHGARATYFLTVPFTVLSILAFLRLREPRLHRAGERTSLRAHVGLTLSAITRRRALLPIVALGALSALVAQVIFEFGPLWLVAMAAPAVIFGPYWAGLVSTLGVGGVVADKIRLHQPVTAGCFAVVLVLASAGLAVTSSLVVVVTAQLLVALLLSVAGIHASALLHDSVTSTIRAGVASGVSTISWIGFLPFSLAFGWVSSEVGFASSAWMVTATTTSIGVLVVFLALRRRHAAAGPHGVSDQRSEVRALRT